MILSFFLLIIILVYVATIAQLIVGFHKIKSFELLASETNPKTFFAIVVPFRNESKHLPVLLNSIKNLNYPADLFEIILIDDGSEDDSVRQVYHWRMENGVFQTTLLENIRLSNSPKKDAITRAIPIIKNQWVVTTDADCTVPENWLKTLDAYIQHHNVKMIAGAVVYDVQRSFLQHFQQLDLASLQGTTIGSFGMQLGFMCNGANLCYTKSLFEELHGFSGNNQLASGDDVFLLQKAVRKYPEQVHYLKSKAAIVHTKPLRSWRALFSQRVRWASKTSAYDSLFGKDLAVIVFMANLTLILSFILCVAGCTPWWTVGVLFLLKFSVDYSLLYQSNRFLRSKRMWYVLSSSIVYPFFCVAVAMASWFGSYEWKGRKFQK